MPAIISRITQLSALTLLPILLACSGSGPADPSGTSGSSSCTTDFACSYGEECVGTSCAAIAPSLYSHIQTASALIRPYIDDSEIDWRISHYDLHIGHVKPDRARAVNSNVRLFEFFNIRYNRFDAKKDVARIWAEENGYDYEDFYLHYTEDVDVPTWENQVLVEGFPTGRMPGWNPGAGAGEPPATATQRWQSRALGYDGNFSSLNYMGNIEHPRYREFLVHFVTTLLDGSHYDRTYTTGPIEGVLCDLGLYYPMFGEGVLDKTAEYAGVPNNDQHPYAHGFKTMYPELNRGLMESLGRAIDVMPNYGHVWFLDLDDPVSKEVQTTNPWIWGEVWISYRGIASPTRGPGRCITYERDYREAIEAIVEQTRAGGRRILGARDLLGAGSARGRMLSLAMYYLVHNEHTYYMYEAFNGHDDPRSLEDWQWFDAIEFDVGQPDVMPAGTVDFSGKTNTTEHYLFEEGPDPYDSELTYRVFARRYTNALVLVKLLPEGSVVDIRSSTTHTLDGSYTVLGDDGTLGNMITEVSLMNNQAVVLIPAN